MSKDNPTLSRRAAPLHAGLIPMGAALLMTALLTDWFYVRSFNTQWETFSVWLITLGLMVALVAALALVVDLVTRATRRVAPVKFLLLCAVVGLSIINVFVHSRDGYTAVAPSGVLLSALVSALLVATAWGGWSLNAPPKEGDR